MLEKGRRNPSIRALFNICEALGSEPSFVLEEVERKTMFKARVVKSS
jgi:transcriptional regulator with XRE-family HTH domain